MKKLSIALAAAMGLALSPVMAQDDEPGTAGSQAGTAASGGLSTTAMVGIGAAAVAAVAVIADSSSDEDEPTTTNPITNPTQTQTQTQTVTTTN